MSILSAFANRSLKVSILTSTDAFTTLRAEWRDALARAERASLFLDVDYLEMAWRHFRREHDQPWLVVVRRGGLLVGLLPLVRSVERVGGLPVRVLRHMGLWEGDRPGLLACEAADPLWAAIWAALRRRRADWELLDLRELDAQAWPLRQAGRLGLGLRGRVSPDTQAGYQLIEGDWETYLAGRSRNTRQAFRRRQRQLEQAHPDARIEVIDAPQAISDAFERYAAIERRGWKQPAGVGLWSDRRQHGFYRELLPHLAARGLASVWLLRVGDTDIAGLVRYQWRDIAYERHAAYDPAYASYSPSTLLCMEAVRRLHGTAVRESDVLGMTEPLSERPAISAWYDGARQTHRLCVQNLCSRLAPARLLAGLMPGLRRHGRRLALGTGALLVLAGLLDLAS